MCDLGDQVTLPPWASAFLLKKWESESLCQLILGNVHIACVKLLDHSQTRMRLLKRGPGAIPRTSYLTRPWSHFSFLGTNHAASNSPSPDWALELSAVRSEGGTNIANEASRPEPRDFTFPCATKYFLWVWYDEGSVESMAEMNKTPGEVRVQEAGKLQVINYHIG